MEKRIAAAAETGQAVFDLLPQRADAGDALLATHFAQSPAAFREAARAAYAVGKSNAQLITASEAVHNLLIDGIADFRALAFWLQSRVPQVSDGNNFGVEVQNFVIEKLKAAQAQCASNADLMSNYVWQRALGAEKIGGGKSSETSTVDTAETKTEDGTPKETKTRKEETTTKASNKEAMEDLVHYIVETDVKHYIALEGAVRELISAYVRAYDALEKNMEKCVNPRGSGSGGGRSSMY